MKNIIGICCFLFLFTSCSTSSLKDRRLKKDREILISELTLMYKEDQERRKYLMSLKNNKEQYKIAYDSIKPIQLKIDENNTKRLIEITRKYGFPNIDRLGAPLPLWLIFQHTPEKYNAEVKRLLKTEVKEKRFPVGEFKMISWHLDGRKGILQMQPDE